MKPVDTSTTQERTDQSRATGAPDTATRPQVSRGRAHGRGVPGQPTRSLANPRRLRIDRMPRPDAGEHGH